MDDGAAPESAMYFESPDAFRTWLEAHHDSATSLWVGFHKSKTGRAGTTWRQSVDEALCFGWIDGVRKPVDDERYVIRFSRRKPGSIWSAVNIERVRQLEAESRMREAGRAAFAVRRENRSGVYSYEQRPTDLPEPYATELSRNPDADAFFASQPPSYRKAASWWIVSAKTEATRQRRLEQLISDSAAGLWIAPLRRP
jgi:uncharacterized protein YdeI (YjbR/CyaY-like superfamily)